MRINTWKLKRWTVCVIAMVSLGAGSLITTRLMHAIQVRADSNRVFEMHVYHTVPGKVPALESQFRDRQSKLLAKHDLKIVGYWVPEGTPDWDNTFIFIAAHSSREEAKKNWDAMRADPDFQELIKENSEPSSTLVEKVDVMYMRPTDYSPMK
jgi:hypothetical protein